MWTFLNQYKYFCIQSMYLERFWKPIIIMKKKIKSNIYFIKQIDDNGYSISMVKKYNISISIVHQREINTFGGSLWPSLVQRAYVEDVWPIKRLGDNVKDNVTHRDSTQRNVCNNNNNIKLTPDNVWFAFRGCTRKIAWFSFLPTIMLINKKWLLQIKEGWSGLKFL